MRSLTETVAQSFPLYDATRVLRRASEEMAELRVALARGSRAEVLDEIADVQYFLHQIARAYGVSRCVSAYRRSKGLMRKHLGKDKELELQEATRLIEASDRMDAELAAHNEQFGATAADERGV